MGSRNHSASMRFALLVGLLVAPLAGLAEQSGSVVASKPSARAHGEGGERVLHRFSDIFLGDSIETGAYGEVQIRLVDDTELAIGPNSNLLIDEFVVSQPGSTGSVVLNAVQGAFRFVSGSSPSEAYRIDTPSATIGIRGTVFDYGGRPDGSGAVAMIESRGRICKSVPRPKPEVCVDLEAGSIVAVSTTGEPTLVTDPDEVLDLIDELFPYLRDGGGLWGGLKVRRTGFSPRPDSPSPQPNHTPESDPVESSTALGPGGSGGPGSDDEDGCNRGNDKPVGNAC